jgi:hypothetical protein
MKTPVESYVVRVYRRRSGEKRELVGVLEGPRLVGSQAFSSVEELWAILEGRGLGQPAKARPTRADPSNP